MFAAKALGRDRTVIYNREIAANLLGEQTRQAAMEEGHLAAVLVLAETLDMRDAGTARHSQLVGRYARSIAVEMDMSPERASSACTWPASCTTSARSGSPTRSSRSPARSTSTSGRRCASTPSSAPGSSQGAHLDDIAGWVLAHHERPDGQGYPLGLTGEQIPIEARILSVVDAYEAMTNDRVYRPAMPEDEARAELVRWSGTQFDPDVVVDLRERCSSARTAPASR